MLHSLRQEDSKFLWTLLHEFVENQKMKSLIKMVQFCHAKNAILCVLEMFGYRLWLYIEKLRLRKRHLNLISFEKHEKQLNNKWMKIRNLLSYWNLFRIVIHSIHSFGLTCLQFKIIFIHIEAKYWSFRNYFSLYLT